MLREGYEFIPNRCRRWETDAFETRLMMRRVVCMSGPEAAAVFYDDDRFTRRSALPPTALTLLQDKGSAAVLDGDDHRHRKELFLRILGPGCFARLIELARAEWEAAAAQWERRSSVVLQTAAEEVLCRAVCAWAGVPLAEEEVGERTRELAAQIDGAGSFGPRQVRGQLRRQRHERWARGVIDGIRSGAVHAPEDSAAHAIANHRERDGSQLDTAVAAVELINILRPTVAVARYVTFSALALHEHPEARAYVTGGGDEEREHFVQEVRRFYPFFPAIGGRVMKPFEWRGYHFAEGVWVLLDIYGTNRDSRAWDEPERFRPERFRDWRGDPFALIPQGGGDHAVNHRCPGEWITIALTRDAVDFLTSRLEYRVPDQDLSVDLSRMPAIPKSGFVIDRVRTRG